MSVRKIITIDEDLCNGCGNCIIGCDEGALALVNGKAKLVKEHFCDGFGDCIGTCPTGALKIEERVADAFDLDKTFEHVKTIRGVDAAVEMKEAFLAHESKQGAKENAGGGCSGGGCPGSRMRMGPKPGAGLQRPAAAVGGAMPVVMKSELAQWPVQLHLLQPKAPFFDNKELVLLSTCSMATSPDVQWRYIRGRSVAIACPKLDRIEGYVEKLANIFVSNNIPKLIVLRMEVPCCSGLTALVREALEMSKPQNMVVEEAVMSLDGEIIRSERIY